MQSLSSKDDLKRDALRDWVFRALDWIAANRQPFYSGVGTVVVVVVVGVFMMASFKNLRGQAWERYSAGQSWLAQGNPDNALNMFNEVINNFGRTPAAIYALLSKGDLLYLQRKFPEAAQAYRDCLAKEPPRKVKPFVYASLGAVLEDSGDFAAAADNYKKFLSEYPDHYLTPKVYESLARSYEASHNPDAAKEIYEKIITMFPGSLWSEKARIRYGALAPTPFQTPEQFGNPK